MARKKVFWVTIKYPCVQSYLKIVIRLTIMPTYRISVWVAKNNKDAE